MASVFSKIIAGEIPGRFVWQDEKVVAFLTIAPIVAGHTLVVPREEVDRWTDLEPALWARCNEVAQHVGRAVRTGFDAERAGYIIAGFEVPHAHIHVFPTSSMADFDAASRRSRDPEDLADDADRIRAALREQGDGDHVPDAR